MLTKFIVQHSSYPYNVVKMISGWEGDHFETWQDHPLYQRQLPVNLRCS